MDSGASLFRGGRPGALSGAPGRFGGGGNTSNCCSALYDSFPVAALRERAAP